MSCPPVTEIFFLVDGEYLEAQACILAPTLKRHLLPNQRAVAYIRKDYAPRVNPLTHDILDAAGIECRLVAGTNGGHGPWIAPYPPGNKILAAAMDRSCDISVFIDTDTVFARPVDFARELGDAEVAACISDYASPATDEESWKSHYGLFGLDLPEDRVKLYGGKRLTTLPYFNAGMIIFRERNADGSPTGFAKDWLEMASDFDHRQTLPHDRFFTDQLTLPILGYKRGAPVKPLEQRMNFNIQAHGSADIAHYHRIGVLWKHPEHGRSALAAMENLIGFEGIETLVRTFGRYLKLRRLRPHIVALRSGVEDAA